MPDFHLYIGYRHTSSWSLRGWLPLKKSGVAFDETLIRYRTPEGKARLNQLSPTGKVPLLVHQRGGAAVKVWFEFWTTASDWAINVGGKPWNSLPAFVPVTFEVMVLFAGVSTVIAFFIVARLVPGKKAVMPYPGVTDHRFVLVLEETDAAFDVGKVRAMLESFNAVHVEERVEEAA